MLIGFGRRTHVYNLRFFLRTLTKWEGDRHGGGATTANWLIRLTSMAIKQLENLELIFSIPPKWNYPGGPALGRRRTPTGADGLLSDTNLTARGPSPHSRSFVTQQTSSAARVPLRATQRRGAGARPGGGGAAGKRYRPPFGRRDGYS